MLLIPPRSQAVGQRIRAGWRRHLPATDPIRTLTVVLLFGRGRTRAASGFSRVCGACGAFGRAAGCRAGRRTGVCASCGGILLVRPAFRVHACPDPGSGLGQRIDQRVQLFCIGACLSLSGRGEGGGEPCAGGLVRDPAVGVGQQARGRRDRLMERGACLIETLAALGRVDRLNGLLQSARPIRGLPAVRAGACGQPVELVRVAGSATLFASMPAIRRACASARSSRVPAASSPRFAAAQEARACSIRRTCANCIACQPTTPSSTPTMTAVTVTRARRAVILSMLGLRRSADSPAPIAPAADSVETPATVMGAVLSVISGARIVRRMRANAARVSPARGYRDHRGSHLPIIHGNSGMAVRARVGWREGCWGCSLLCASVFIDRTPLVVCIPHAPIRPQA